MFANTAILAPVDGVGSTSTFLWTSPRAVFFGTCAIAALASLIAGISLNLPTALACAMSLNLFTAAYAQASGIPWQYLVVVCAILATVNLVLSFLNIRAKIIAAVPREIMIAIPAGVGALLVDVAIKRSAEVASTPELGRPGTLILFFIGVIIIFGLQYLAVVSKKGNSKLHAFNTVFRVLNASSYLVSTVVVLGFYLYFVHLPDFPIPGQVYWAWQQGWPSGRSFFERLNEFWGMDLLWHFIMLLDIAGSPTEFVERDGCTLSRAEKAEVKRKSYLLDSGVNILAAAVGVTPVVYYAENYAGWRVGGTTGKVAVVVSICFLCSGLFVLGCIAMGWKVTQFIPPFVVMPALLVVGVILVAESVYCAFADAGCWLASKAGSKRN